MKPIHFLFFFLIFFSKISFINSSECSSTKNLKIGILKYEYIDYAPYLYYEIGNFASNSEISYTIELVENNYDKFDIIFGEYYNLKKFQNKDLKFDDEIFDFYQINNIHLSGNILPLDLDTFVILSKNDQKKLTFDELSNFYNPVKYTLGINFSPKDQLYKLFIYNLKRPIVENSDISLEYILTLYSNAFANINKNIIESNFLELVESFDSDENIYTVFSDGILLNKNINYKYFQLFPSARYSWSDDAGFFKKSELEIPISFFGFSAYINNQDNLGIICHLINEKVRINTFRNFNLQISPLSEKEIQSISLKLPNGYEDLLKNKNKYIYEIDSNEIKNYELFMQIISRQSKFQDTLNLDNYLN